MSQRVKIRSLMKKSYQNSKKFPAKTRISYQFRLTSKRETLSEGMFVIIVLTNFTRPLIELFFLQTNSTILDMFQGVLNFSPMSLKFADNRYSNFNVFLLGATYNLIQPGKQTVIYIKSRV